MTHPRSSVKIKKISDTAVTPQKSGSSYTLFCSEETIIQPNSKKLVSTGITMAIPRDSYGQLFAKDENRFTDKPYLLLGGVIDSDYRGEVKAILFNDSNEDIVVKVNDPLCNIMFIKILTENIDLVDDLNESERGDSGFGSTGK